MKRWMLVAAGLVVALVVGGAGFGWRQHRIEASRCAVVHRLQSQQHSAGTAGLVVVGDSYAQGYGLADAGYAWPFRLGVPVKVYAASGTGWTKDGLCGLASLYTLAGSHRKRGP